MSTPNRPGSRPVPPSEQAEQPRTSSRPQPAVRPGTQPQPAGANRPPVRPPNGAGQAPGRPGQRAENPPAERQAAERPGAAAQSAASEQKSSERPSVPPAERQGAPAQPAAAQRPAAQSPAAQPPTAKPPTAQPPAAAQASPAQQPPTEAAPRVEADRPAPPRPDSQRQESARPDDRPFDPLRSGNPRQGDARQGDARQGETRQPATAAFQNPQSGPVRSAPVQNGPAQNGPAQNGPVKSNGAPQSAPPWQRGSTPQQNPVQQNPVQPGPPQQNPVQQNPVQGPGNIRQPQNQPQTNLSARGGTLPTSSPVESEPDDRTQRREAAKTKAAGIDGPTRHIERKDLAKDMPDLSEVRHSEPTAEAQRVAQPVAIAAREDGEPLRATIQLRKIDPWSTLKISLVIAVSLFFVWMVAVGLLYAVLDGMGVWDRLNSAFTEIVNESGDGGLVSAGQVFGYAAVIGIINLVLFTALTTIGSFIYNLSSDLVGGVEVTLADRD